MKDLKLHASLLEQVSRLRTRGLIIDNETFAENLLSNANYYRLTGYLHNFKDSESDKYCDGITIERLKRIYEFDRKLTRILMYALEDVEETFKTRLSYTITQQYPNDPLIYLKPNIYRDYAQYISFLAHFYETVDKNKDIPFVKHHKDNYGGNFPMWVAVELFTMGNLCAIYENLQANHQKKIAKTYNTGSQQMKSWIENLKDTRNHLAHYMRIYNFNLGKSPAKCKNHPKFQTATNMIFDQVCVMADMFSDAAEWNEYVIPEIARIIEAYSNDIELRSIGFPDNWKEILSL